jgi:hypothetical protein
MEYEIMFHVLFLLFLFLNPISHNNVPNEIIRFSISPFFSLSLILPSLVSSLC